MSRKNLNRTKEEKRLLNNERCKNYRANNRELLRAKRRAYYQANKEAERAKARAYYATHKEYYLEYEKQYYQTHKQQHHASCKKYHKTHRESINDAARRRYAEKNGLQLKPRPFNFYRHFIIPLRNSDKMLCNNISIRDIVFEMLLSLDLTARQRTLVLLELHEKPTMKTVCRYLNLLQQSTITKHWNIHIYKKYKKLENRLLKDKRDLDRGQDE